MYELYCLFWEMYVHVDLPTLELFEVIVKFSLCPKWRSESLFTAFRISSLFEMLFRLLLLKMPFLTSIEKLMIGPGDERIAVNTLLMPSVAMDRMSTPASVSSFVHHH